MKAAYFEQHGGLDELKVGEVETPTPGPGQVRIKVVACGLNRLDLFVRAGWPGLKLSLPHIGGTDVAGIVDAVGPDTDAQVGSEVLVNPGLNFEAGPDGEQIIPSEPSIIGENRPGGLAQYVLVPANRIHPKPANMSWEEAACLPLTLQTAMQMLRRASVAPGHRVLVVGGGGGVSVMLIQLAKALGAWVCVTTGGPDKVQRVTELGADHVIDYKADAAWSKTAYLASQKLGFDAVFDSVGAATWEHSLRCLRPGGRLVTCGATTGAIAPTNIQLIFWKQLQIIGSTMGTPQDLEQALAFVAAGDVRPIVDSVWSLDDARQAQERLASGNVFGKVIVKP